MKIFIGCDDIASILSALADGFRKLDHTVTTFSFNFDKNSFYKDFKYDIDQSNPLDALLGYQKSKIPYPAKSILRHIDEAILDFTLGLQSEELIETHDLFVFIGRPWLNEKKLLPKIKAANKKIIFIHTGSDVRHISAYIQQYNEDVDLWEKFFHTDDLNKKVEKTRYHELYADLIYSVPDQAGLLISPYNHIYIPLKKIDIIKCNIPKREVPVIVHAPSRTGIKGTPIFIEVIERLKNEGYQFEFELLYNVPNSVVLEKLTNADILLDELFLHGPGVLSAEAMKAGCAVATRTLTTHKDIFNPPVLNISPQNVYEQVKYLLDNMSYRIELAERGLEFVNNYNHPVKVASNILEALSSGKRDYKGSYYLEKYYLPQGTGLTKNNKKLSGIVAEKYFPNETELLLSARKRNLI